MPAHLISGGARSGKSAYAEKLALESGRPTLYIATALPGDEEMRERIEHHRRRRPAAWRTRECPVHLGSALREEAGPGACVIVDCLTLWLANLNGGNVEAEREDFLRALLQAQAEVLVVTNELGSGIVPAGAATRSFVDEHGLTNQRVAQECERITLMVCGQPLAVKLAGAARG
ncbi:MAG: adenosylcobinamide kinase / adenosylcobinamide-phosphate guanylyltransferase [Betaproteobacteria bacterium]|jgi:adenosylcobinamide kinase/adenosylcobinamide-phosphate guanylyltransferase|nr:adenosylcobinamide kinase / adenosylcobinamide-phosphate guanylyltransferase [Betaproteobacteria bacterium]